MIKKWIKQLKEFVNRTKLINQNKLLLIILPIIGFIFWYFTRARVAIRLYYYLPSFLKVNDKLIYVYQDEILYFYLITIAIILLMLLIGKLIPTPITFLKEKGCFKTMLFGILSLIIIYTIYWLLIFIIRFLIGLVIFVVAIVIILSEAGRSPSTDNNSSSTDAYDREKEKREKEFEFIRYAEDKKKRDREGRW
ncbi:hypothetical protein [Streptococcus oralis]|uniref:Uncharacterized protein n=1 Tax=Streptococcus oralis TaxID=1303 RepID=A0A139NYH6_STROR|nr:hypothetical protein [Streptococcus oralis]KXT80981.1 hypothetical protein SORDD15_00945 [Streptococcus oralis]